MSASSVGSKQVINGSIAAKDVKAGTLTSKQLKDGAAVSGADVIDTSLSGADIADDSLGGGQIDEASLKLGSGGSSGVAGGDLAGSYPNPTIAADAIAGAEVLNGSLSGDDIDEATLAKVGDADTLDGTNSTGFLAIGSLAGGDLGGLFSNLQLGVDSVTAAEIATGAAGSSEIPDSAVASGEIAAGAVAISEIATNAVGSGEISANNVGNSEIADDAVGNSEIAGNSVTSALVADGSLTRADNSVFDTTTSINLPEIPDRLCVNFTLDGGVFDNVQIGDIGYVYPPETLDDTLIVQTGMRQSTAGIFQYRICNFDVDPVNDGANNFGVRLVR